jgi:hypothetical protein
MVTDAVGMAFPVNMNGYLEAQRACPDVESSGNFQVVTGYHQSVTRIPNDITNLKPIILTKRGKAPDTQSMRNGVQLNFGCRLKWRGIPFPQRNLSLLAVH